MNNAVGNLTYDGTQQYTYDAWNRMTKVAHAYRDGSGVHAGHTACTIGYDGRGRRISKAIDTGTDLDCTYYYYYDSDSIVETRKSTAQAAGLGDHVHR